VDALRALLTEPSSPPATLEAYWAATASARDRFERPVERALVSALQADRLAHAFASGYQAALCFMFPLLARHARAALCATEAGGGHPRELKTALKDGRLSGTKTFVTGAPLAEQLFVVASIGERDGKNQLRVARIEPGAAGVSLSAMPELPFVPELPHAEVTFTAAAAAEVLEGDGWERYLKPFRTIEDVHVHAALLGYLVSLGRRSGWPLERLAACCVTASALAARAPSDPATHVALAGLIAETRALLEALDFSAVPQPERERWERDKPLLDVAGRVRQKRLEKALALLASDNRLTLET